MSKFGDEQQGGQTFVTVFGGKLVTRVNEGDQGAVARQLTAGANEGKTVWERMYSSVQGMITGGGIVLKEFGAKKVKEIHINLDDDVLLQLPMNLLSHFGKVIPNIDRTEPVKVSVYKNKKGKTGLNVSQGGDELKWFYTKEAPNGLPQPEFEDGEWDFRDHDKFLIASVKEFFADYSKAPEVAQDAPEGFEEAPEEIPF